MASTYVIDAIVRQTTVLIAALATAAGQRAPLAGVANQVFADLVKELRQQGIGNKVIADMFCLALRTYHDKVARFAESRSQRGRSLWEAVLAHVQEHGAIGRVDLLQRFARDDEAVVRGVLKDLVDSGMLAQSGMGDHVTYRAADPGELAAGPDADDTLANLVLVAVHRHGPIAHAQLLEVMPIERAALQRTLTQLEVDGRLQRSGSGESARYACDRCVIAFHDPEGWQAAVYDHYQAMVSAICTKLARGAVHARPDETIGGSTYAYDLWQGHPLEAEARGLLAQLRRQGQSLRARVEAYNERHPAPADSTALRVVAYVGQTVITDHEEEHDA